MWGTVAHATLVGVPPLGVYLALHEGGPQHE